MDILITVFAFLMFFLMGLAGFIHDRTREERKKKLEEYERLWPWITKDNVSDEEYKKAWKCYFQEKRLI